MKVIVLAMLKDLQQHIDLKVRFDINGCSNHLEDLPSV
jgi:hypothetical protein